MSEKVVKKAVKPVAVKKTPAKRVVAAKKTPTRAVKKPVDRKKVAKKATTNKRPVGKPRKYTPAQMAKEVDAYFRACDSHKATIVTRSGRIVEDAPDPEPYSIAGLAVYLKLDRQRLYEYIKITDYQDTLSHARARIEGDIIKRAQTGKTNPHTAAFLLRAMDRDYYGDKQVLQIEEMDNKELDTSKLTTDELAAMDALMDKAAPDKEE